MADEVPFRMSRALKATLCEKKQQFGEENTACRSARNLPRLILTRSFPFTIDRHASESRHVCTGNGIPLVSTRGFEERVREGPDVGASKDLPPWCS